MPGEKEVATPGVPSPGDVAFGHVPDWMDSGFFERSLRAGLGDPGLRVTGSDVRAATGKGENYVSVVYAATVCTEARGTNGDTSRGSDGHQEHHLIIKCLPSNKARKIMSNNAEFFRKEVDMYELVLPEFARLASGRQVALPWARHYSTMLDGDGDFMVMEDLRPRGYAMKDRLKGLNALHLGAALRALAKFHAFSYALQLKDPEVFRRVVYDRYPETMFAEKSEEMISVFIQNAYQDVSGVIREWNERKYLEVADWMEANKAKAVRDIIQLLNPDDPGAVLNHGDYWVNNMLFRYPSTNGGVGGDDVEPDDVKLLDFQISRVCSPAADLWYLKATSVTKEVSEKHWDQLLGSKYHQTFWDTLQALGAKELADAQGGDLFTLPWLRSEMRRFVKFALVTCITTSPVVLAKSSEAPDLDTMTEDQLTGKDEKNPFSDLAKNKLYQERLRGILDELIQEGLFQ